MSTCYAKAEAKAKLFRQAGPVMCGLVHVLGPETIISSLNVALYRSCVLLFSNFSNFWRTISESALPLINLQKCCFSAGCDKFKIS